MKMFEVCFFTKDRSERVIKEVMAETEQQAVEQAKTNKKVLLNRSDWGQFEEVTATFARFLDLTSGFNQMVDAEVFAGHP